MHNFKKWREEGKTNW